MLRDEARSLFHTDTLSLSLSLSEVHGDVGNMAHIRQLSLGNMAHIGNMVHTRQSSPNRYVRAEHLDEGEDGAVLRDEALVGLPPDVAGVPRS